MNLTKIRKCMSEAHYIIEKKSTSIPIDMSKESG